MADGFGAPGSVTVRREECGAFWQVTAWPGTLDAVAARLGEIAGVEAPGSGGMIDTDIGRIARVGPLVWWIVGVECDAARALSGIAPEEGAALDLTDSRVRFVVSGPHARDTMMRLAPLDFRDRGFPVGQIAATAAHHVSVHIARQEDAWEVYVTTTFARALAEMLEETTAQWG